MIEALTGLGYAIIGLAIVIGIGIVILGTFSQNIASCPTAFSTYNTTSQLCQNATGSTVNPSLGTQDVNTLTGYLGTSSGGLATWIPIIIVLVIGMLFLGAFLNRKGKAN